eukprot:gnl/TRDRNA2_/TRDRNA2_49248_c0_seq1.p1 gnl/TRDRNA2_/TRDRNA2_49248_c0~~gnl/TRDRNA2_/TRDRNA2_49248_c0_seq1.p1  ORF type:complete len:437 (-),score=61.73 gnl/TRDRNA2_/TRDRNA2_49248_c0_seq1:46-1236(-)
MAAAKPAEPLVLKVLRLKRPLLEPPQICPISGSGGFDAPKLLLPMALKDNLVGEPFAGYLHLANTSSSPVTNVVVRVELQIGATKYVLLNNSTSPLALIEPGDFFDATVEHELHDPGTYCLTCNMSYNMPGVTNEPCHSKRVFKISALPPFTITHSVVQLDTQLLVECVVENATSGSLGLSTVTLDCRDGFEACVVGGGRARFPIGMSEDGRGRSCCCCAEEGGPIAMLKPRGAHSIIFSVMPRGGTVDVAYVRDLDSVGSLALGWHVPDGPSGCAQGHQIRIRPCGTASLDLRVVSCPGKVRVEAPFQLEVEVVNRSSKPAEPSIIFDLRAMAGVKVHGATQHGVGRLEPYCTTRVALQLFVAVPGMHGLRGVSLVDDLSHARSDFDSLCDILAF